TGCATRAWFERGTRSAVRGTSFAFRVADWEEAMTLPLEGVRVVDITWAWAGPYCSLQLAHLGAEVIRIESHLRPDMNRRVPPYPHDQPGLNWGGSFNQWNQGKLSLSVDFARPEGADLVRALVAKSDIV